MGVCSSTSQVRTKWDMPQIPRGSTSAESQPQGVGAQRWLGTEASLPGLRTAAARERQLQMGAPHLAASSAVPVGTSES